MVDVEPRGVPPCVAAPKAFITWYETVSIARPAAVYVATPTGKRSITRLEATIAWFHEWVAEMCGANPPPVGPGFGDAEDF